MIGLYQKKPVEIEAVQWTGENIKEVKKFMNRDIDESFETATGRADITRSLLIETMEGTLKAEVNDYIIKGVQGEFYPCKPDVFEQTYDFKKDAGIFDN